MMFFPPFLRYPYGYNYRRYNLPLTPPEKEIKESPEINVEKEKESRSSYDSPLFDIFGMQLYFDDVLIICLIFFLFQEGVDDEWLYIALILLLLS